MNGPKISIGIPVYNQAKTIRKTIEAALNQKKKAFEVVVSQNHSDDGTERIVDEYKSDLKVVIPSVHLAMAANWNFAVRSSRGDYVGLCSGDDILLPNYVSAMSNAIAAHPEGVFYMAGWQNLNEITCKIESRYLLSMRRKTSYPHTVSKQLRGPKASFAAFCFSKNAYERAGGYDETFRLIQDWVFQFDMAFQGSFVKIDQLVAQYVIQSRPILEANRQIPFVEDRIKFINEKLPKAIEAGVSFKEVQSAAAQLFEETLTRVSDYNLDLHEEQLRQLEAAACFAGCMQILSDWSEGKWRSDKRKKKSKDLLSYVVRKTWTHIHSLRADSRVQ